MKEWDLHREWSVRGAVVVPCMGSWVIIELAGSERSWTVDTFKVTSLYDKKNLRACTYPGSAKYVNKPSAQTRVILYALGWYKAGDWGVLDGVAKTVAAPVPNHATASRYGKISRGWKGKIHLGDNYLDRYQDASHLVDNVFDVSNFWTFFRTGRSPSALPHCHRP